MLGLVSRFVPGVLGLAAIFAGNRSCSRAQIFGGLARVSFTAVEFILGIGHPRRSMCFIFFSHGILQLNFALNIRALPILSKRRANKSFFTGKRHWRALCECLPSRI